MYNVCLLWCVTSTLLTSVIFLFVFLTKHSYYLGINSYPFRLYIISKFRKFFANLGFCLLTKLLVGFVKFISFYFILSTHKYSSNKYYH